MSAALGRPRLCETCLFPAAFFNCSVAFCFFRSQSCYNDLKDGEIIALAETAVRKADLKKKKNDEQAEVSVCGVGVGAGGNVEYVVSNTLYRIHHTEYMVLNTSYRTQYMIISCQIHRTISLYRIRRTVCIYVVSYTSHIIEYQVHDSEDHRTEYIMPNAECIYQISRS